MPSRERLCSTSFSPASIKLYCLLPDSKKRGARQKTAAKGAALLVASS